jgi:SAM-dependent methyltransferase
MATADAASPAPSALDPHASGASLEESAWQDYFLQHLHDRSRVGPRFLRQDFNRTMARLIPADARVLEVGCARGDTLAALPNSVRHGIDFTAAALREARAHHPELDCFAGDALSFATEHRYDAIICDRLIHSIPDIQRLLENVAAHLAPGGRVFLSCFNFAWEKTLEVAEALRFKLPAPPGNWLSDSDLQNLFALCDLDVVKYEDRLLLPLPVPVVARVLNRYLAPLPVLRRLSLYRVYVLRRRPPPRSQSAPTSKSLPAVSVVVPARNEAGNIPEILRRTPLMGDHTELIFVEGHSTDDTWNVIGRLSKRYQGPLRVSAHRQPGKGKGDAVREGFRHATGDILMILDADLTVAPEELPKFYEAAVRGVGEYIQGTRLVYPMEDRAMRFLNKLGNIFFSQLFTFLLNQPIKDTLCGTKVIWRKDYGRLALNRGHFGDFDPFGDFDLIFGAAHLNLKLVEIPIRYRNRIYGTTNISRFRHGWMLLRMSAVAARKLKFM